MVNQPVSSCRLGLMWPYKKYRSNISVKGWDYIENKMKEIKIKALFMIPATLVIASDEQHIANRNLDEIKYHSDMFVTLVTVSLLSVSSNKLK